MSTSLDDNVTEENTQTPPGVRVTRAELEAILRERILVIDMFTF